MRQISWVLHSRLAYFNISVHSNTYIAIFCFLLCFMCWFGCSWRGCKGWETFGSCGGGWVRLFPFSRLEPIMIQSSPIWLFPAIPKTITYYSYFIPIKYLIFPFYSGGRWLTWLILVVHLCYLISHNFVTNCDWIFKTHPNRRIFVIKYLALKGSLKFSILPIHSSNKLKMLWITKILITEILKTVSHHEMCLLMSSAQW